MIDPLPTPPQSTDPTNFEARADAFMAALPTFTTQANATAAAMNLNSTTDASVSSLLIATGTKTFAVSAGKSFQPGMYLVAADTAAPSTNSMFGQITSYDVVTGALVLNVMTVRGSGTKASWVISQSSAGGAVAGPLETSGITGAAESGANASITSLTGITSINGQQYARGGVRQTVNAGSVDANGLPNFLATSVNLNLPISAKATNLVIAAANGFNSNGPVDRIGVVTADTTLTVAASSSLYIYADVSAAGVVTFGSGTLAPSYITGGTPSTTNGQFTFDTTKKIGYVGNGSAAVQTYRVYLGEATTSGSAVTAVVNYALNGEYAQVDSGIPSQTRLSRNHNIGCTPRVWRLAVKCTSSDAGYAVGEEVSMYYANGNIMSESVTNLTYGIITNITTVGVVDKTAHTGANISSTNWDTVFYANRGW